MAEREGFEPSVGSPLRLISSQVHSTTLPPLRVSMTFVEAEILSGPQLAHAAHVGAQRLWHTDAAIGLLVVLQHRHQGTAHGQA